MVVATLVSLHFAMTVDADIFTAVGIPVAGIKLDRKLFEAAVTFWAFQQWIDEALRCFYVDVAPGHSELFLIQHVHR